MTKIEIECIKGGYIYYPNEYGDTRELIPTTDELFRILLLKFEGRAESFHGNIYGKVVINREEPK